VSTIGDLFSAARVLAGSKRPAGKRLAIVCNGGGPGVLAADRAADLGLSIAELAPETIAELDTTQRQAWSRSNPVDILGDVNNERYAHALKACLDDPNVDGVIAMLCPQSIVEPLKMAKGMAEMARDSMKPVLACWLGEVHVWESRKLFNEAQIPSFRAPEAAADAFAFLAKHHQNRSNLLQTPGALSEEGAPDVEGARIIIETALSERRKALTELESKALLSAFRIPVNPYMVAHSASEALLFAEQLGFPVAMKALSPSIEHKTESHAMMLNLASAPAVRTAYADIIAAVKARHPQAAIEGISVERMVSRPNGRELSVGVVTDPVFGPVITFGQDSMHADAVRQRAVALPPLNRMLIANLLLDSRVTRLLRGTRSKPPVNIAALADLLQRVSEMVCELPWLKQMEIDPCVVNEQGAVVLSARMLVDHHFAGQDRYRHMAICPYPIHLASRWQLADGTNLLIRPIRPEDADLEQEFVRSLSDQTRYLRFQLGLTELTPAMLARFTQIDYDREMALVVETTCNGRTVLIGEARYNINPDGESCEFGLVVSDQWRNRGLGAKLMQCLMDAAREKGLKSIHGDVLRVNEGMHSLMTNLGFWEEQINDDDDGIVFSKTL
jgi:acetyltransferase